MTFFQYPGTESYHTDRASCAVLVRETADGAKRLSLARRAFIAR